jgi:hypothetical protein
MKKINHVLSISTLIEDDLKTQNKMNGNDKHKQSDSILEWMPDNITTNCSKCNILFTFINRKHHCRYCGKIFCGKCANYFIHIPNEAKTHELIKVNKMNQMIMTNILDIKYYISSSVNNNERVCHKCYIRLLEWKELNRMYSLFALLPLDINDYLVIRLVCKNWYKIAQYHLSQIKEIQYRFTDKLWTSYELNMIHINRHLLIGHSKWIVNYIISNDRNVDGHKIIDCKNIWIDLLNGLLDDHKIIDCNKMMCIRGCSKILNYVDLLLLVSYNFKNIVIVKWIFNKLNNLDITTDELLSTLNIFINTLKNACDDVKEEYENFLLKKSKKTKKISNKLFWILTQLVAQPEKSDFDAEYFRNFRKKIINILDDETYNQFQYGYDFTKNIIHILTLHPDRRISAIKEFIGNISYQKFYLPIDITKTFYGIKTEKIYIIHSKTEPIVLPCIYEGNELYYIMLKRENVKNEELMMNIIRLVDILLKKEELLDLNIMTYNIQPVNIDELQEYGYIEFVPESHTLYSIREEHKFTLQNFILEKNPYMTINEFRNKFAKSCAAFCVISYVFGIGDRHLDNIMVTNDGTLFNIDYGYILGRDPKPIVSHIRITPDMIDALGGISSVHYQEFDKWCGIAYNCIRRHINLFYNMLLMLDDITRDDIKNYLSQRLVPGISDKEAHSKFMKIVENSYDNYKNNIIDYFHKQYRSSDKQDDTSITNNISGWVIDKLPKWIGKII